MTAQGDRGEAALAFSEDDRSLFLKICGIRPLSECVRTQPQTEILRPSPTVQDTVRLLVPYIQRFLRHHDELSHVYAELLESNIDQRIRSLSFVQVSSLTLQNCSIDLKYLFLFGTNQLIFLKAAPLFHAVTAKIQSFRYSKICGKT